MISDRKILSLSSHLTEPFCQSYRLLYYRLLSPLQKFESLPSKVQEIAFRGIIATGALAGSLAAFSFPIPVLGGAACLGIASKLLRYIGFSLQQDGYTHVKGEIEEKTLLDGRFKLMTWNICGLAGGFSIDHGGVVDWRLRLRDILKTIREEDPDVLVLHEVVDTALAEALIKNLSTNYAHFYIHLGSSLWGVGSGCMVLTKTAVDHFSFASFATNSWKVNKGFVCFGVKESPESVTPSVRVLGSHFHHGYEKEDEDIRMKGVAQMIQKIATRALKLPTILCGDLNIQRDLPSGKPLEQYLSHGYLGDEYTCTNRLTAQWDPEEGKRIEETVDYVSLVKENLNENGSPLPVSTEGVRLDRVHLSHAFDNTYDTTTATSDHHAVVAEVVFPQIITKGQS